MAQQTHRNRRWVLASRPHGAPVAENFRLEEDDVATLAKVRFYCVRFFSRSIPICAGV